MSTPERHPTDTRPATGSKLSYVLIADPNVQRVAACLDAVKPFKLGVLIARDGEEAIKVLERFGPPVLLITDLSLPGKDGFALIEALRRHQGHGDVIAWSPLPELREFAAQRFAGLRVRTLRGTVGVPVIHGAIARALGRVEAGTPPVGPERAPGVHLTPEAMRELVDKARSVSATAGVAVYLKGSGQAQFRASVTWASNADLSQSPYFVPRVFDWVLESGDALVLPDLATQQTVPISRFQDVVRGLVAVPIVGDKGQTVGTICVFDVHPLTLGGAEVEALKALGRGVPLRPAARAPVAAVESRAGGRDHQEGAELSESCGLLDRRGGDLAISRELARARREQAQLSVILFDINARVKGHAEPTPASDALATVGETLTKTIRGSDLAIRWGREELLAVLPGLGMTGARQVAERVRAAMQASGNQRVAVSAGVAEFTADEPFESVVWRANERVRAARESGHNRVA
ncbi:MAG TPA: diguanylate cyclase [Vicinamibacterales bacterium]|nr:diguanylate cyclase [Vicinamibacterales bacterium]